LTTYQKLSAAELPQTLVNTESTSGTPDVLAPGLRKDTDLQAIIDAWSTLPDAVKAGILAMVKASKG